MNTLSNEPVKNVYTRYAVEEIKKAKGIFSEDDVLMYASDYQVDLDKDEVVCFLMESPDIKIVYNRDLNKYFFEGDK